MNAILWNAHIRIYMTYMECLHTQHVQIIQSLHTYTLSYICMYMHTHTHTHTHIHTCTHMHTHTRAHTRTHTHTHAHTRAHTRIHTHTHAHTCTHTHTHYTVVTTNLWCLVQLIYKYLHLYSVITKVASYSCMAGCMPDEARDG